MSKIYHTIFQQGRDPPSGTGTTWQACGKHQSGGRTLASLWQASVRCQACGKQSALVQHPSRSCQAERVEPHFLLTANVVTAAVNQLYDCSMDFLFFFFCQYQISVQIYF